MSSVASSGTALLRLTVCFLAFVDVSATIQPTISVTPPRQNLFLYVVVDSSYSEEAVQTVFDAVVRADKGNNSTVRDKLKVVQVNGTSTRDSSIAQDAACRVVRESPVIHLTTACLRDHATRLRTPVLSFPVKPAGDISSSLAHVSLSPGVSSELPIVLEVASKLNWRSSMYVGDANADSPFLDQLLRQRRTFGLSDVVLVNEGVDPGSLYNRITNKDVDFVLVHCQTRFCYEIVKRLLYLRSEDSSERSKIPWFMTEALTENTQTASSAGQLLMDSMTYGLQKALPNSPQSDRLLERVSSLEQTHLQCYSLHHCPATLHQQFQVLNLYDSLIVLRYLMMHKMPSTVQHSVSLVEFFNEAKLQGIGGLIQFEDVSLERTYPTLYNVLDVSPFLVATIGVYDSSSSRWLHELRPLATENELRLRRGRYRRRTTTCPPANGTFRVTTMIEPPFIIYDPNNTMREAHNGPFTGLVVEMLNWLAKELSFTYKMSEPPDLKYGSVNEQGVGNGMVGQLMNCGADVAGAAFAITAQRSKYIHFTKPYMDVGKGLLAYKGPAKTTGLWAFLNPFDLTTRLVIVACLAAVSIVFALLSKISPYHQSNESETSDGRQRSSVPWPQNSLWFFYTTSMQQGPDVVPSISGKVLVAGWFFFCLVIVATYTANLAAFLTVKSFSEGIHSLDDLAAQTEVVYGTVKDTSILNFFETSPVDTHQKMYTFMINTDGALVDTAQEAIDKVQLRMHGDYVFIWDIPILDYIASREPCSSQVVGRPFNSQGYGLALPQGMPYQLNFSLAVLKMREIGFIDRLTSKWLTAGDCEASESAKELTDAEEVKIGDIVGVFIILAVTIGLSFLIAVVERLWWNRNKMQKVDISNPEANGVPYATNRMAKEGDYS